MNMWRCQWVCPQGDMATPLFKALVRALMILHDGKSSQNSVTTPQEGPSAEPSYFCKKQNKNFLSLDRNSLRNDF